MGGNHQRKPCQNHVKKDGECVTSYSLLLRFSMQAGMEVDGAQPLQEIVDGQLRHFLVLPKVLLLG